MNSKDEMILDLAKQQFRDMQDLLGSNMESVRKAFLELYAWTPEFAPQAILDAYEENGAKKEDIPPFFSEVFTYEILGKYEARTLRSLIHTLGETLGLNHMDMRRAMGRTEEAKPRITEDTPLSSEDFDAFEMLLQAQGYFVFENREQLQRVQRALRATREVHDARREGDVVFKRMYVKDLQVGDQVIAQGRLITIHGFLAPEGHLRKRVESPVGDGFAYSNDRYERYWVQTREGDEYGIPICGTEKVLVRRRSTGES
jgi:hypothetical protein